MARWGVISSLMLVAAWAVVFLVFGPTWEEAPTDATMKAEWYSLQMAFDSMIYEREPLTILPHDTNQHRPVNDWSTQPRGTNTIPLSEYVRKGRSFYYYCWDTGGRLTGLYVDDSRTCADPPDSEFDIEAEAWPVLLEQD